MSYEWIILIFIMRSSQSPDFVSQQVIESRYLFLDLSVKPRSGFAVTCAGREACEPDYRIERDGFHYHAIEFVRSGSVELSSGGEVYRLESGSVFAYNPDSKFTLKACGEEAPVKYFVDFAGNDAAQLISACGLRDGSPLVVSPQQELRELFDQLVDCNRHPTHVAQEMADLLSRLILLRIRQDGRVAGPVHKDSYATFARCRDYMREHFKQLRSMDTVAGACHLDRAYLSRLFKKHSGESPYQFLTRMKMESAAELLRYRSLPVKAVAAELGYDDPFHFSRVFKKTFGLAPQHFAKA